MTRKRWPAIEPKAPHWRRLYRNGRLTSPFEYAGQARGFADIMSRAGHPLAAIVKVTPK